MSGLWKRKKVKLNLIKTQHNLINNKNILNTEGNTFIHVPYRSKVMLTANTNALHQFHLCG